MSSLVVLAALIMMVYVIYWAIREDRHEGGGPAPSEEKKGSQGRRF